MSAVIKREVNLLISSGRYREAGLYLLSRQIDHSNLIQVRLLMKIIIVAFGKDLGPIEHRLIRRIEALDKI